MVNLVWDPAASVTFDPLDMNYLGYRERRPFADSRRVPPNLNTKRTTPTDTLWFDRPLPARAYPLLQFWTMSVFCTLRDTDVFAGTGYLAGMNDAICGYVWLDGFEETTFFQSGAPFEVILLSESYTPGHDKPWNLAEKGPYRRRTGQWPYYNVLLSEWSGGIAERRGLRRYVTKRRRR